MKLTIKEQVKAIEMQIHSPQAKFTLMEKMQYLNVYFCNDSMFDKEALDIARSNISKEVGAELSPIVKARVFGNRELK